jgi:hypothetical protein
LVLKGWFHDYFQEFNQDSTGGNVMHKTNKSNTTYIIDYEDADIEHPQKIPSDDEIKKLQGKQLMGIADKAKMSGYINLFSLCYILAENFDCDMDRLLKEFEIDLSRIAKSKGLTQKNEAFNHRRGKWYYILLRLTTGLNPKWEFDNFLHADKGLPGFMPTYFPSKSTGEYEPVSGNDKKECLRGHGYVEKTGKIASENNQIVSPLFIKISDLREWLTQYLKLPLPEKLFPNNGNEQLNNQIINNSDGKRIKDPQTLLDNAIKKVGIEVDQLYDGMKMTLKRKIDNSSAEERYNACQKYLKQRPSLFSHIQGKHLVFSGVDYWDDRNASRGVKGGILKMYIFEEHPELSHYKKLRTKNYQALWNRWNDLKKDD